MRRLFVVLSSLVFTIAGAGSAHAGPLITFSGYDEHWVMANNYAEGSYPGEINQRYWNAALDGLDHGASASSSDGTTATGRTNFGDANAETMVLKQSWELTRADGGPGTPRPGGTNAWYHARYQFTVNEELNFTISGFFDTSAGNTEFDVFVREVGTTYGSYYSRLGGSGASTYTLGVSGYTGPPNGTLLAGHTYEFGNRTANGGITAEEGHGEVTLTLSRTHAVPEPASLTLFGLGALGLAIRRKRRRLTRNA